MLTKMVHSNKRPQKLPDNTSSDEEVPTRYLTTEEREVTIPGSAHAMCIALSTSLAQGNPVVPCGFLKPKYKTCQRRKPQNPTMETAVQTEQKVKSPPLSPVVSTSKNEQQEKGEGKGQGH